MAKRDLVLKIKLNDHERSVIVAAGEQLAVGPSTFARMAAIKAAGLKPANAPRRKPDAYAQALAAWTGQLGRIGNTMNQCARVLNSGGSAAASELSKIEVELRALREAIIAFDCGPE